MESPENYEGWFKQTCFDEFQKRNIPNEEIIMLATAELVSKIKANLEYQEYYKNADIQFSSHFLTANQVKDIYKSEFNKYVTDKNDFNSQLPIG